MVLILVGFHWITIDADKKAQLRKNETDIFMHFFVVFQKLADTGIHEFDASYDEQTVKADFSGELFRYPSVKQGTREK